MNDFFSTKDPLNRRITLSTSHYYDHIIKGHEEIESDPDCIKKTIENPDYIYEDSTHFNREVYYGLGKYRKYNKLYVTTVVEFETNKTGNVITAYLTDKIKESWGNLQYAKT
ncbi:MAG: hypothetical protein RBT05_08940 [Bacteroidales bacterium]|jgi:hypothetical protein|nr:hypothetical protein [Actinomycetota bacterium]MDX9798968.1 hypothetical protein [Bacteroidales bacterium]